MATRTPDSGSHTAAPIHIDPPAQSSPSEHPDSSDHSRETDPLLGAHGRGAGGRNGNEGGVGNRIRGWFTNAWEKTRDLVLVPREEEPVPKRQNILWWILLLLCFIFLVWVQYDLIRHKREHEKEAPFVCVLNDSIVSEMSYSYDPREFKELYFHLDRFTQGDIIVSQHSAASKDTTPPTNVTIKVTAKGDTVYSIQPFKMIASPNSIQSRIEANVFRWDLFWWPGGPPEEQLCNRVHVEIIFPPGLESYKLLRIQNRSLRGDVTVSMDPNTEFSSLSIDSTALEIERQKMKMTEMMAEGKKKTKPVFTTLGKCPVGAPPTRANLMTIEQVDVKAKNGNVTVTGVRVTEELKATSELGEYVYVDADAKKRVYAYSSSLAVVELTQNHRNLDVTVEAEYWAQVEMKSTFIGHLEMMTTTNVFPPILIQYDYEFVPQIVEWQLVTGYIPDAKHNGTEPPNELPRIQIRGEGTIVKLNGCGQN